MYYLNSRFYDAEICRFINADSMVSGDGEQLLGYNMYTYCFNNPANLTDDDGNWPKLGSVVRKVIAVTVKVVNTIINRRNKKKIEKELKQSYTIAQATSAINCVVKKYSEPQKNCSATYHGTGVNIENSYLVRSRYDQQKVSMIIERTEKIDGERITQRITSDMASEWLLHNIAYDATSLFSEYSMFQSVNISSVSAFLDFETEDRMAIVIGSKILEVWGMR